MAAFAAKRLVRTRSQLSVFVIHVHFFQFWRKCINLSMQQFLKDYEATPLDKKPILVIGMQVVILYIARIAKAASHKLLGKSSLNVSFACPVLPMFTTTTMTMASWKFYEEVGGCTQESWRLSVNRSN